VTDTLREVLAGNRYPGRGVVWARLADGTSCGAYFLTGRSDASRARELRPGPGEIVVAATDADGAHDALRHYVAARETGGRLVFGNGEQVAQVAYRLDQGDAPADALGGLAYEPDPPIFTPRVTAVVDARGRAWFGGARRSPAGREEADLVTVALGELRPGDVVLMTTYRSDGHTVATAEPYAEARTAAATRDGLLTEIWSALDPELRVAAAAFEPGHLAEAALVHRVPPTIPDRTAGSAR
jgi:IMP cyclohydrolase